MPLERLHLRAHALVRIGSTGGSRGLLLRFEDKVFFGDGNGLHGCDAGEDGEDLVVAVGGEDGVEEEFVHCGEMWMGEI